MFEIIAVSNRLLCGGNVPADRTAFLSRLAQIADSGVDAVMLREKDLNEKDYLDLARDAAVLFLGGKARFIVHTFPRAALEIGAGFLELPWSCFQRDFLDSPGRPSWAGEGLCFGVSVHTPEEARLAREHGASWVIGGNVFPTPSKQGLPGRGLEFLAKLREVSPPKFYGIGGISTVNIAKVAASGASGACLLSPFMQNPDPKSLVKELRASLGR